VEAIAERPDGVRVPFIPHPTPILDADGNLTGAVNVLVDISRRKDAESRQKMLLDELNHRVKNNMQVLYAMLTAAGRETGNAEVRAVLAEATQRVGAMSAAQQVLYGSDFPVQFDARQFIETVGASCQNAGARVRITYVADAALTLPNEMAMPLSLILNELLTNAAKHGKQHPVNVTVSLGRRDGAVELAVSDDGPGFDLKPSTRRSSGLGLVGGLAQQIGGSFTVERRDGAHCVVRFKDSGG
jgi:two-component sensor histidine kinase